jgi:hypothetical protein
VIVVVGSPIARPVGDSIVAGGLAAEISRAAASGGAAVQLVGRVGEDPAGDLVLLDLAAHGVGHVAILREAGRLTPALPPDAAGSVAPDGPELDDLPPTLDADGDPDLAQAQEPVGLSVDAADVELALRYVPDYRVLISAGSLDAATFRAVLAASSWSGAHLIVLVAPGEDPAGLPDDVTVLERPTADPDGAFATMIASYAAAVDSGSEPGAAFTAAQGAGGWAAVAE